MKALFVMRCRLHRLQPRGRPPRARRRGDSGRRSLHRSPRNLARAVDAPLHELDIRDAAAVADVVGRRARGGAYLAAQIDVRRSVADPPSTPASTSTARSTCCGRRSATAWAASSTPPPAGRSTARTRSSPPRVAPGRPQGAVRPVEVLRGGLCRPLLPAARPVDRLAPLRQRLRPAPGPARRGRRDRDLLRAGARGRQPHRLRRRRPDARLRLRERRGRGERRRRRPGRKRSVQHRLRGGDDRARARRGGKAAREGRVRAAARARALPARSSEALLDCSRARDELGWHAQVSLEEGLDRALASLRS